MGLMDMLKTSDPMAKFYAAAEKSNVPQGGITGKLFSAMFPHGLGNLAFGRSPEPMPPLETPEGTALMADLASNMMVPGTFIGPKGLARLFGDDAAKGIIATAENKLAQGVPKETVFQELGVFKGPEGKWRYEIDDSGAKYRPGAAFSQIHDPAIARSDELSHAWMLRKIMDRDGVGVGDAKDIFRKEFERDPIPTSGPMARAWNDKKIEQLVDEFAEKIPRRDDWTRQHDAVMQHDQLYTAYPDMRNMEFSVKPNTIMGSAGGQYDGGVRIGVDSAYGLEAGKSIDLHELQHAVQEREGFARGGSPASMADEIGGARLRADELRQKMEIAKNVIADEARWILADPSKKDFVRKATDKWQSRFGKLGDDNPYGVDERKSVQFELEETDDILRRWAQEYSDTRNQAMNDPMDMYQRLAGEAEARAVQDRMNMNMDERRALFPEYAGRSDLIVRGLMSAAR